MPDADGSEGVKQQPITDIPKPKAINPPRPPDDPPSPPAQSVANDGMENAVHDIEDRVKRAEWLMIGLTAAIALFALCTVIASFLQWRVMSGQLGEMQAQFELTDRAWVEIGCVSPPSDGRLGLAFWPNRFLPNEKLQAVLGFEVNYKNVGHSTAVNIKIVPELYLMEPKHYSDNGAVEAEERRFCSIPLKDAPQQTETSGKSALFPDESSMSYQRVHGDITEATTYAGSKRGRLIMPVLIVCVDYWYQSSAIYHQTRAAYDLLPAGMMPTTPRPHLFGTWVIDPDGLKTPGLVLQRVDADDYAD